MFVGVFKIQAHSRWSRRLPLISIVAGRRRGPVPIWDTESRITVFEEMFEFEQVGAMPRQKQGWIVQMIAIKIRYAVVPGDVVESAIVQERLHLRIAGTCGN